MLPNPTRALKPGETERVFTQGFGLPDVPAGDSSPSSAELRHSMARFVRANNLAAPSRNEVEGMIRATGAAPGIPFNPPPPVREEGGSNAYEDEPHPEQFRVLTAQLARVARDALEAERRLQAGGAGLCSIQDGAGSSHGHGGMAGGDPEETLLCEALAVEAAPEEAAQETEEWWAEEVRTKLKSGATVWLEPERTSILPGRKLRVLRSTAALRIGSAAGGEGAGWEIETWPRNDMSLWYGDVVALKGASNHHCPSIPHVSLPCSLASVVVLMPGGTMHIACMHCLTWII